MLKFDSITLNYDSWNDVDTGTINVKYCIMDNRQQVPTHEEIIRKSNQKISATCFWPDPGQIGILLPDLTFMDLNTCSMLQIYT